MTNITLPLLGFLFISIFATKIAHASDVTCQGRMRLADCGDPPANHSWAVGTQPTFSASCTNCALGSPDGGVVCHALQVVPSLRTGLTTYDASHFEELETKCGNEALFRYTGPVVAGATHVITLGTVVPVYPSSRHHIFSFDVVDAAPMDGGADSPPPPDAGGAKCGLPTAHCLAVDESGCSFGGGAPASLAIPLLFVVAPLLQRLRRRLIR